MACTLPSWSHDESKAHIDEKLAATESLNSVSHEIQESTVNMRNVLLDVLHNLLHDSQSITGIDTRYTMPLHFITRKPVGYL